ncbi:MAG TPA: recombinase family protein [Terracidiphilus sp.]|nr:recombinase family protein [Terracidiphilus sp.]
MTKAAIYARYSSDLQRPTSIEDQIRKCRQVAEQKGWLVLAEFIRSDSEISGAALTPRTGLLSLIEDVKKRPRPFDVVVIDDTSRLGRNLTDVLLVSDLIKNHDAFLYFVSQQLNSNDESFRLLLIMNGMIDEQFLVGLSDKVHRGQEGRVLKGLVPSGKCYGYRNVPIEDCTRRGDYGRFLVTGVRQEIIEEEAIVIRQIFQMRSEGHTLKSIAVTLNSEGIPSPRPLHGRIQDWNPGSLYPMLHNPKYRGQIIWNRTHNVKNRETGRYRRKQRPPEEWVFVEAPELRIVSDALWDKVKIVRKQQFERLRKWSRLGGLESAKPGHLYLFSGLLICGYCGYRMKIVSGTGDSAKHGCPQHESKNACPNIWKIMHLQLEEQLVNQIIEVALRSDNFEYAIGRFHEQLKRRVAQSGLGREKAQEDAAKLRAEQRQLESQARNLVTAISEYGTKESPCLISELTHIERRIETLNKLLAQTTLRLPVISVERIREFVQRHANNISSLVLAEPVAAKHALRTHFRPIVLMPKQTPDGPVFVVNAFRLFGVDTLGAPRASRTELEVVRNPEDRVGYSQPAGLIHP